MIKVAIVGAGFIGEVHAKACNKLKNARIVAIVDDIEEKAKNLAKKFKAEFFTDLNNLFNYKDIDVVAVCVPTYLHAEVVKKIANVKKAIFCEKPLALSLKEADEMINVVKKNNVKSMVGHILKFWPEYVKAKEIVDSGELGKPLNAFCQRLLRAPSRAGWYLKEELIGGAAIDLQIHDLDYLIYLFGKPNNVESQGIYDPKLGGWAHMNTNVRFENEVYGVIDDGWSIKGNFPFTMAFRIICTEGAIEWIFKTGGNLKRRTQRPPITVYKSGGLVYEEKVSQTDPYYLEWEYFINCLENDSDIKNATFEDGRVSLKLALATIESAKELKVVRF